MTEAEAAIGSIGSNLKHSPPNQPLNIGLLKTIRPDMINSVYYIIFWRGKYAVIRSQIQYQPV